MRYIQELLGHGNIRTTERYTHVSESALGRIKSPMDKLVLEEAYGHVLAKVWIAAPVVRESTQIGMLPALMRETTSLQTRLSFREVTVQDGIEL